ncbi:MAG: hypothetical protein ABIR58_09455 [Gemmatimonadaceae bacterium]
MLEELAACEGSWRGTSRLQLDPPAGTLVDSPATATIAQLANGTFIRIDYKWSHEDKPHEGSYLLVTNNIWPEGREDLAVDASYTRV